MTKAIAPSILSFSHGDLRETVRNFQSAGAECIHVDVMDGSFVPPITFGDGMVKSLRSMTELCIEAHLMIQHPETQIEAFAAAGCNRLIFQMEVAVHANRLIQAIRSAGMQPAVAINPGTAVSSIDAIVDLIDQVLVMTVNPGYGGQSFLPETLTKIRQVKQRRPDVRIEVDGGIDPSTICEVEKAGASLFVVGSYLQKTPNIAEAFQNLDSACD